MKSLKIKNIKSLGIKKTIDLEVDSKDHNFYYDNILVSNSHATGYAYLTAITVYLKANYPKQFFLSLLRAAKHESKPLEEVAKIQKELCDFNIQLLAPDILKSDLDFSIQGENIRYGLAQVKGISDKTIEKLNKFKHEYSNKFEIFHGANEAGISISTLNALIKSGAVGGYKCTRSRNVLEAQTFNILTPKEKKYCLERGAKFNFDLLKLLLALNKDIKDEKGRPVIKDSRFETIKKHYQPFKEIYLINKENEKLTNWFYEHEMLGFSHSTTITDIFREKTQDTEFLTIKEIFAAEGEPMVRFAGKIMEMNVSKSKKNKDYMRVTIEDDSGSITGLIFGDKIQEHDDLNAERAKVGDIVVARGRKKSDDAIFLDVLATQKGIVTKMAAKET